MKLYSSAQSTPGEAREHKRRNLSMKIYLEMLDSISRDRNISDVLKYRSLLMAARHLYRTGGFTLDPYTYSKSIVRH
jgi:hypothetical protein